MKKFYWSGLKQGIKLKGTIEAYSKIEARNNLKKQQIKIHYLYQGKDQNIVVPINKQAVLFKQISTLLLANVSLMRTFNVIKESSSESLIKNLMQQAIEKLQRGDPIHSVFNYLDPFCLQLLMISEKTGELETGFEKIVTHTEKKWLLRKNILKTLTYPAILLVTSIVMLFGLLLWVIPQFQIIFSEFHAPLPLITQLFIAISNFIAQHFLLLTSIITAVIFILFKLKSIKIVACCLEKLSFRIPILSSFNLNYCCFQFFLALHLLFESGVSITDSLLNIKNTIHQQHIKNLIQFILTKIQQGYPLHLALKETNFFPALSVQMVQIAEESGKLDQIFQSLTQHHQQQLQDHLTLLQQLLEPAIMLIISILIGLILFALYLPIFNLGSIV